MIDKRTTKWLLVLLSLGMLAFASCSKTEDKTTTNNGGNTTDTTGAVAEEDPIDFNAIKDTYEDIASQDLSYKWAGHNVHDPIIRKFGDKWYSYSTDVAFGTSVRFGMQIRESKNLVEWTFKGWALNELPAEGVTHMQRYNAVPSQSLWAPSVIEYNGQYRMYYSFASSVGRVSCIGLATSSHPVIGWKDQGSVVSTIPTGVSTNAIDPSVIITPEGEHWMVYGSSWDAIYLMQLDPETGLELKQGDLGKRIAHRGFTGGGINGNIEGPEIIYNEKEGMYYLFIAYDWLATKYNIRVGRSANIQGPYLDMFGTNMNELSDNYPMIVAPYGFKGHAGYQGVSHCTVFDEDGKYFVAHQGRPANSMYSMNMHVREIFWTEDGWPIASPERYAAHAAYEIAPEGIPGKWELIDFEYTVVPGFAEEQTTSDIQRSGYVTLNPDGSIEGSANTWSYQYPWLSLTLDGVSSKLHVSVGRDWENKVDSTLVMTGLHSTDGMALWGKKILD